MSAPDEVPAPPPLQPIPPAAVHSGRRWAFSLIWLVPLAAALAGLGLVIHTYLQSGPTITISFQTATGLEAGKTEVRYKNVVVGKVRGITLSRDHRRVLTTVELSRSASDLAVKDSQFWVERPRIGVGGVSGISTLLSGAYIGVDIGTAQEQQSEFVGLERPPTITRDQQGRRFLLVGEDAGSLVIGAPVYYRRIPVGRIASLDFESDGRHVELQIFVDAPYDHFVSPATRFWNASGVDLSVNAEGLKLNTEALATVLAGGVAFETPDDAANSGDGDDSAPAADGAHFTLFRDRTTALAPPDDPPFLVRMRFRQSTRGLSVGAPIDFQGVTFGYVRSMVLDYDAVNKSFYTDVVADLYLNRLGLADKTLRRLDRLSGNTPLITLRSFVDRGLRAQLRPGNLITGQLYIALDFVPNSKIVDIDPNANILQVPTLPGSIEQLQKQIQDIITKLDAVPFEAIGNNLRDTLHSANGVLQQLDTQLAPQAQQTLEQARQTLRKLDSSLADGDSPLQSDARNLLEQAGRAAYSLRTLADYLQQHPEALLRGKSATAAVPSAAAATPASAASDPAPNRTAPEAP